MRKSSLKRYFFAGILVLAPIWVTFVILEFFVRKFDTIMSLLPLEYRPDTILGVHIPGLGLIVVILVVLFTGILTTNFIGNYLLQIWEKGLSKIPLVRSIYAGVKKILNTMLSPEGQSFRKVLLIEYPRKGCWSLAFLTGNGFEEINSRLDQDMVTVFVPTTPNPTGGFLLLLPKSETVELDLSVDEAFKLIISLGVILPKHYLPKEAKEINN